MMTLISKNVKNSQAGLRPAQPYERKIIPYDMTKDDSSFRVEPAFVVRELNAVLHILLLSVEPRIYGHQSSDLSVRTIVQLCEVLLFSL